MLSVMITSLSVLIEFSFFGPTVPVPFHLCYFSENYKSTFEEKKFYATVTKKLFLKCSQVMLQQVAELPSNSKRIVVALLPKLCFVIRVCMTLTIHG